LSQSLRSALGTVAPDAFAVGDVDQDGKADVVVASGQTVRVLYNQGTSFVEVQQLMLDASKAGPKVTAIGIGALDGTVDKTKLLDIVVASNSAPDRMGNGTLYLQAFRQAP
jgi:hypothetical protein